MSSETVFEYRHKKFDQGKRLREDDSISSADNGEKGLLLDLSDPSKASISSTTVIPIAKKQIRKRTKSIPQQVNQTRFYEPIVNSELHQRLQQVNLNHYIRPSTFPPVNETVVMVNDGRVVIKTEVIEPNIVPIAAVVASSESSPPKRRRTQSSSKSIKTEPRSSPDIMIKEELIELNTNLPAIPREAYEDICKFRSNMVRKFPKKERSVKEQERRDKNTYACRKSRRVKKIEQVAVEEEYKNFKNTNLRMAEYAIRAAAYFKELMKITAEASTSEVIVVD